MSQFTAGLHPALLKIQELSDPFQPKPLHDCSGANAKSLLSSELSTAPIRGCRYRALRRKQQNSTGTKVPHITWKTLPQQLRAGSQSCQQLSSTKGPKFKAFAVPGTNCRQKLKEKEAYVCRNLPTFRFKLQPSICLFTLCLVPSPVCHHAGKASLGGHTKVKGDQN